MNKLTALIEAAKADCIAKEGNYGELCGYGNDILELCALLEKAEKALVSFSNTTANNQCVDYKVCCGVAEDLSHTEHCPAMNALAAIKQWKEQT